MQNSWSQVPAWAELGPAQPQLVYFMDFYNSCRGIFQTKLPQRLLTWVASCIAVRWLAKTLVATSAFDTTVIHLFVNDCCHRKGCKICQFNLFRLFTVVCSLILACCASHTTNCPPYKKVLEKFVLLQKVLKKICPTTKSTHKNLSYYKKSSF